MKQANAGIILLSSVINFMAIPTSQFAPKSMLYQCVPIVFQSSSLRIKLYHCRDQRRDNRGRPKQFHQPQHNNERCQKPNGVSQLRWRTRPLSDYLSGIT